MVEKKAHRGRLWKLFGSEQLLRRVWEYFTPKRAGVKKILADAAQEKQGSIATGGVQLVEANTNGEHPTGYWWCSSVSMPTKRKSSKHMRHRWGFVTTWSNALKLLANQQKDGDSPIQNIVTGLHERSRRGIMDGLRSFIRADNHRAVEVGHLRAGTILLHVRKPKFS